MNGIVMAASHDVDHGPDAGEDQPSLPAEGLATTLMAVVALAFIFVTPFATHPRPPGRAWFLAPAAWPLVCLGLTVAAGAVFAFRFWRNWRSASDHAAFRSEALSSFGGMKLALEHALWFCLYLAAVSYFGFALATFAYLQFVVWRAGLRGWRWAAIALLITVALVLIFRIGIGIWFPLAPVFDLLPDGIAKTLGGVL